jgi:hypothetical protein
LRQLGSFLYEWDSQSLALVHSLTIIVLVLAAIMGSCEVVEY